MKLFSLFFLMAGLCTSGYATTNEHGKELHMQNCTGCHDSSAYTRSNRKVNSLPRLGTQVRMCRDNLGITWFDDEVADVIDYLNKDFYKF